MASMLSLSSNPFNPFTQYELWKEFDRKEGFDTAGLLARSAIVSDAFSEADQERAVEDAIESIINNPSFAGLYKRVSDD